MLRVVCVRRHHAGLPQAKVYDHISKQIIRFANIFRTASARLSKQHFFAGATREQNLHALAHSRARRISVILVTLSLDQRTRWLETSRNDGHHLDVFDETVALMEQVLDQGVADFVRREFARRHAVLRVCCKTNAAHDALYSFQHVVLLRFARLLRAHAVHRRFVANVCNLGARQPRDRFCANRLVSISGLQFRFDKVNLQNLGARLDVWKGHSNLAVKAARTQERRVE